MIAQSSPFAPELSFEYVAFNVFVPDFKVTFCVPFFVPLTPFTIVVPLHVIGSVYFFTTQKKESPFLEIPLFLDFPVNEFTIIINSSFMNIFFDRIYNQI